MVQLYGHKIDVYQNIYIHLKRNHFFSSTKFLFRENLIPINAPTKYLVFLEPFIFGIEKNDKKVRKIRELTEYVCINII